MHWIHPLCTGSIHYVLDKSTVYRIDPPLLNNPTFTGVLHFYWITALLLDYSTFTGLPHFYWITSVLLDYSTFGAMGFARVHVNRVYFTRMPHSSRYL